MSCLSRLDRFDILPEKTSQGEPVVSIRETGVDSTALADQSGLGSDLAHTLDNTPPTSHSKETGHEIRTVWYQYGAM